MTDDPARDGRRVSASTRAAVERYLTIVTAPKHRGRQRTVARVRQELDAATIASTDPNNGALEKLRLAQQILDLQAELVRRENTVNAKEVEDEFVQVAGEYAHHRGISYEAWRAVGVEPAVLKRAGIART
jgi:hypothetical protein